MNILLRIGSVISFICVLVIYLIINEVGAFANIGGWFKIVVLVFMGIFVLLNIISLIKYFNKSSSKNKKDKDS